MDSYVLTHVTMMFVSALFEFLKVSNCHSKLMMILSASFCIFMQETGFC